MSHRIFNNVGYKKVYPMSLFEDDSFCHYCGRQADILNPLEWDHVPPLNVKIPEEFIEIKKTLIRACRECNGLASDVPHLDYLERHFWLKAAYLRRYKRLIISEGNLDEGASYDDPYLNAIINNSKLRYQQLLDGIGFGIKDINHIESPILEVRTKKGRKIADLIVGHLRGFPTEQDDLDEDESKVISTQLDEKNEIITYCSYGNFVDFLAAENERKITIGDQESYESWIEKHPSRFDILDLPKFPEKSYMTTWFSILGSARKIIQNSIYKNDIDWAETACVLDDFISCLVYECKLDAIQTESDYIKWCCLNEEIAVEYALPHNPCSLYEKDWKGIYSLVKKNKILKKINY